MRIVWSAGDPHGIGPEIILKSFLELKDSGHSFVVAGSFAVMDYYRQRLGLDITLASLEQRDMTPRHDTARDGVLPVLSVAEPERVEPGTISGEAGRIAMESLRVAAELCDTGMCDALVTAPLHKEAVSRAGYRETGHTGFLASMFGVASPCMMFADAASGLKVALATIHEAIERVPSLLRNMDLDGFLSGLAFSLQQDFACTSPRIAVLGLNPHASDGGLMGSEEREIISPCIGRLSESLDIHGPFAADGFFGSGNFRSFDIIVAMYHDQGLLPFKLLAFDTGVNVTLGLPIVRTSPDHGTSFDIAGKGCASERSFLEAVKLAISIAENRKQSNIRS
jgi:4-hydroxythreonine-4-phosphate dehydrogenase